MNGYAKIFTALHEANVQYIIVGGVAMNLHNCPRFTNDIDILLALDEENLMRMQKVMTTIGYEQRIPLSIQELGDEQKAVKFVQERNLLAYTFYDPKNPVYSLDILVDASLKFDHYQNNRVLIDVWNLALPVVSIDDLIDLKKGTNREKDALDIAMLLEYKGQ